METKLVTIPLNNRNSTICCILDIDISEDYILKVYECNQKYFEIVKTSYSGVVILKFEHCNDKIIMRTFSNNGHEAATYYVKENNMLYLYDEPVSNGVFYRKNGLHVVEYEENMEGIMIYRMLDDQELDPVGDGFTLEEAILFAENYHLAHDIVYN